jgi:hypothetical protein
MDPEQFGRDLRTALIITCVIIAIGGFAIGYLIGRWL